MSYKANAAIVIPDPQRRNLLGWVNDRTGPTPVRLAVSLVSLNDLTAAQIRSEQWRLEQIAAALNASMSLLPSPERTGSRASTGQTEGGDG